MGVLALALALGACSRFPRNNPVEGSDGQLRLERSEDDLIINDSPQGGPFNNGNGLVERRETVLVTVPIDATHVSETLTATVTAEDRDDGRCISALVERSSAGDQLLGATLQPTRGDTPAQVLVGPLEITLGGDDCDPDEALHLRLDFRIVERDVMLQADVELELSELDGVVTLEGVVIDDELGDREQDLDPGESVVVFPSLENSGDALLRAVELDVAEDGRRCLQGVRFRGSTNGRSNYGDIPSGAVVSNPVGRLELTVDEACDRGESLELTFEVRDASDQTWSLPWSSPIQAVPSDDDEDDAGADDDAGSDRGAT